MFSWTHGWSNFLRGRSGAEVAGRKPDVMAPAFLVILLGLALVVTLWAPWRGEAPAAGARPTAVATTVALGPPPPAAINVPAPPADDLRPVGVPVKRTDWLIVRSFQEHGGPSPTGAVDIGIVGNKDAVGTPIYATHDGVVRILRNNARYGNLVAVKNGRWSTTYGHLDQIAVTEGQQVKRGDRVGTMGKTGAVQTPQLDYQVWEKVNGEEVNRNPADFLNGR